MRPIARRGSITAWADENFDPATDEVELRSPGNRPQRVLWQRALKFGYWEPVEGDAD